LPALFPFFDLRLAGFPIAWIKHPDGSWDVHKIKIAHPTGLFFVKFNKYAGGVYRMDKRKREAFRNKIPMYIFDSYFGNPIPINILAELHSFMKKNKMHKIRLKDIKNAGALRRMMGIIEDQQQAVEQLKEEGEKEQAKFNEKAVEIANEVQVLRDDQKLKHPKEIVRHYPLILKLMDQNMITEEQGLDFAVRLERKQITPEQFIEELQSLKLFEVQHPISVDVERALEEFQNFRPWEIMQYIEMARQADKRFYTLASPTVKPMKLGFIFIAALIGIIAIVILGGADLGNFDFKNSFTLPPMFGG